jgi:hypothetical protein
MPPPTGMQSEEEEHVHVFPAELVALMREMDVENSEMLTFDDIVRWETCASSA